MMRSFKPGGTAFATVLTCLTSIQSTLCAIPVDPGVVAPLRVAVGGLLVVLTTIEVGPPGFLTRQTVSGLMSLITEHFTQCGRYDGPRGLFDRDSTIS